MKGSILSVVVVIFTFLLSSCSSSPRPTGIGNSDPASYGMAKKTLKVGTTTQQQVLETFGAPNITTKGTGDVLEVWTYEKVSSEYVASQVSLGGGGGAGVDIAGKVPLGGGVFGSYGKQKGYSSVRTVTLIIKFDSNELVSDYRIMETNF